MDTIIIKGLEIFAHHGVYENEKAKGQRFIINAEFEVDTVTAGFSDDMEDTLVYAKACELIKDYLVLNQVNLPLLIRYTFYPLDKSKKGKSILLLLILLHIR